jgi:hypothetical protein
VKYENSSIYRTQLGDDFYSVNTKPKNKVHLALNDKEVVCKSAPYNNATFVGLEYLKLVTCARCQTKARLASLKPPLKSDGQTHPLQPATSLLLGA